MPNAERIWTNDQQAGISTVGRSLLVSAAAGSGKTAVLAERCAYLVCDAPKKCDIDQLLVVTFTESAAAEMKSRIQQALRRRLSSKPDDLRLARQLALAEHAHVSTVHGFCSRVLRQNFHLLGLDPFFQIIDADEADLFRQETARDLFDRLYSQDATGDFQRFIDCYGDGRDEMLLQQVIATHELLCSLVDPSDWIEHIKRDIQEAATGDFAKSALGQLLADEARTAIIHLGKRCTHAVDWLKSRGEFPDYLKQLNEQLVIIRHWFRVLKNDGIDMLVSEIRNIREAMPKAPIVRGDPPNKKVAKEMLDSIKGTMKSGVCDLLARTTDEWQQGIAQIAPHSAMFLDLVAQFSKAYTAAKEEERGLDFADLERLALNVLRENNGAPDAHPALKLSPSEVARSYQSQFHHVLVDEYQDINEIQDAILTLVSRESVEHEGKFAGNLFCVGDVKQSIFRFRLAEPARFLDRQDRFRANTDNAGGKVIDLRENFRSREPLLEAINGVFSRMMTREAVTIEYDQSHRLRAGRQYPPQSTGHFTGAPIELHLMPANLDAQEEETDADPDEPTILERADYEAMLVARRIRDLMGLDNPKTRRMVIKPDAHGNAVPQPIDFGDIVILLRSMQFKADTFADCLRGCDIPVHSEGGSGFFASAEVRDMLALLGILDNQQLDIPLATVLRSPLASLPQAEDALARVRLKYPEEAFHEAARKYAEEQTDELAAALKDFFTRLADWRDQAHKRPVAELIWNIYDSTGYLAFCAGLDGGAQRVANLVELHDRAGQFGTFIRQGLYRFLRFLETLREQKELSRPSVASEAESVVRIMSVHRSKGLEFPVVIVPDLGKKHNLSDSAGAILVDRVAGLGMAVVDEARRIRYPSLTSALVKASVLRQTLAEEMRLLYVAMTRAKEHLILVGTAKNDAMQRWQSQWNDRAGALPTDAILAGRTPLDWIGPVAAMTRDLRVFEVFQHNPADISTWQSSKNTQVIFTPEQLRMASLVPLSPAPSADALAQKVIDRFKRVYRHHPFTTAPASAAVTSVAGHALPETSIDLHPAKISRKLDLPSFIQQEIRLGSADVGTLTHLVMQHLHFDNPDIESQIQSLVQRKVMTAKDATYVDRQGIAWMLQTPVGQMLRQAGASILRELPFALARRDPMIPAESNDPMDQQMVRGRIDLLVPKDDGVIVVDYKTDRVEGADLEDRAQMYRGQMQLYRDAIERVCQKPVKAIYLVFLSVKQIREC